jgi:predicted AlkP superfamily phosphohydrolase/phosphomutase
LQKWASPTDAHRRLERIFGAPEPVDEVFGRHHVGEMLGLRRRLLGAPARVAEGASLLLAQEPYDLVWLTFCAAHVAGHQFWDLSQLDTDGLDADARRVLGSTLDDVYVEIDRAIDRVVASLPEDADVMLVSPVGMDANTSRADLLPEMLRAILEPEEQHKSEAASSIWRLRASLPVGVRARVAKALPERVALDLTSRLELRSVDWSKTRAFAHPAENQGYVRLNLHGRERDGIVAPEDADALLDEIATALSTFRDLDGHPAVESVEKVAEHFGSGARAELLPDLVVRWTDRHTTTFEGVRSEQFGTVRRHGVGSGRSGNHTEGDAWALVVPGKSRHATLTRPPRLEDIAATALALSGDDAPDLVGEPLLERA